MVTSDSVEQKKLLRASLRPRPSRCECGGPSPLRRGLCVASSALAAARHTVELRPSRCETHGRASTMVDRMRVELVPKITADAGAKGVTGIIEECAVSVLCSSCKTHYCKSVNHGSCGSNASVDK